MDPDWITSSYSGGNNNCVQARRKDRRAAVRDSKVPDGAVLAFPMTGWDAFVVGVREGGLSAHR
ncbi:DUF397 domain-containing protein [Streptomyces sp. JJ66]|uniref:DUF397 domain-containing protein n=1 Tax=Streptomyces sp. JJ66 TaxID=2803843 RepID=UPI001C5632BB|nr:DUF397 domain-containing protein [Streptomyces sp. JJ66]MBW1601236.1 DUF397 domain-containing protein [Streptomyces sp. JJ66]